MPITRQLIDAKTVHKKYIKVPAMIKSHPLLPLSTFMYL